jgi:uncharacterized protein (TIGR03545 family)
MKRLNQLITRLIIIGLAVLVLWVARMPLANRALSWHASHLTGAKVDIRKVQFDRDDQTLYLNQLEIADPQAPLQNMVQAEVASLKLATDALAERRLVIEEGRLSQLKFGAPRTNTGTLERGIFDTFTTLPAGADSSRVAPSVSVPDLLTYDDSLLNPYRNDDGERLSQKWRDSLTVKLDGGGVPKFEVASLIAELDAKWKRSLESPRKQLSQIEASLVEVEKIIDTAGDRNPLRNLNQLPKAGQTIESARDELKSIANRIDQINQQAEKDRWALSQARMRDQQSLAKSEKVQKFDSQLINQLLVGDIEQQLVANSLDWFQQFREAVPVPGDDLISFSRGRNIRFGDAPQQPKLVAKRLQIDGDGTFANSYFRFAGDIENFSSEPALQDEPTKFNIRAQGATQVVVSGVLDRRGDKRADSISFRGTGIKQPSYVLGERGSVLIAMAENSLLHVETELKSDDGRVSGEMKFTFDGVVMHVDAVHADAGGRETAARLNETLSAVSSFEIKTQIQGSIDQPETAFVSDLGPQVASSLESVFVNAQQLANRKKELRLKQAIDQKLESIKETMASGVDELGVKWRAQVEILNRLEKRISTARGPSSLRSGALR